VAPKRLRVLTDAPACTSRSTAAASPARAAARSWKLSWRESLDSCAVAQEQHTNASSNAVPETILEAVRMAHVAAGNAGQAALFIELTSASLP
jgi:hypothetical protein